MGAAREQIRRRHPGSGLECVEVTQEGTGDSEPVSSPHRAAALWCSRPGQGRLHSHDLDTRVLAEIDELGEQPTGALELESEAPAQDEVVVEVLTKSAHLAPPGQGRAISDREGRSTFA